MTLQDLELEILKWQRDCLRRFTPLEGESYRVRLLPVKLENGKPFIRYAQHWKDGAPMVCPQGSDPTVVDRPRQCPLCEALGDDTWADGAVRYSYLTYCFVIAHGGIGVPGDQRYRLHQWWMPRPVFKQVRDFCVGGVSLFSFNEGNDLLVRREEQRILLELTEPSVLTTPDWAIEHARRSVVTPERRVRLFDLEYEAMLGGGGKKLPCS